jgi:endo-alpha-1,4-polygalactosaminidase (GH114 family)
LASGQLKQKVLGDNGTENYYYDTVEEWYMHLGNNHTHTPQKIQKERIKHIDPFQKHTS